MAFDPNSQDLRDAIQEKRRLRKRLRDYDSARPRMAMAGDTQALLERAAASRHAAAAIDSKTPLPPATIEAIKTGLENQQDAIRSALDALSKQPLRKAVNGDLDHTDSGSGVPPLIDISSSFMRLTPSDDDGDHPSDRGDIFDRIVSATEDQ